MPDVFVVPCPPWCRRPFGHDLSAAARDDLGTARRVHLGVQSLSGCELEQFETVDAAGQSDLGELSVCGPHGRVPVAGLAGLLEVLEAVAA